MALNNSIKKKINQYLKERLGMYDYRRGWLKGDCPYCEAHKFGVNLGLDRTNCFRCEANPKPIELVIEMQGFTTRPEAIQFLGGFEGLDFYEEKVEAFSLRNDVSLPESYKNIRRGKNIFARQARGYLKGRGFDLQEVSMKGWGYCTSGKYQGYIIIPFYRKGQIAYFNARKYIGDGPKFNNPNIEDFGIGKSMLIYNMDALAIYTKVFAVESAINASTMGDHAIAFGGKKVSNYQKNAILKSPVEKVVIGLDPDAIEDAIKLALDLWPMKKVKIMQFPEGLDINDIGKKASMKIVNQSRYLDYNGILRLKHSL